MPPRTRMTAEQVAENAAWRRAEFEERTGIPVTDGTSYQLELDRERERERRRKREQPTRVSEIATPGLIGPPVQDSPPVGAKLKTYSPGDMLRFFRKGGNR